MLILLQTSGGCESWDKEFRSVPFQGDKISVPEILLMERMQYVAMPSVLTHLRQLMIGATNVMLLMKDGKRDRLKMEVVWKSHRLFAVHCQTKQPTTAVLSTGLPNKVCPRLRDSACWRSGEITQPRTSLIWEPCITLCISQTAVDKS